MNRAIISQRITSILAEIERLNNALYAMNTTDIQRYPDNYEVLSTDAALRAERITCRLRHLIYATTSIKKEEYLRSAETMQGIEISENGGILDTLSLCRGSADWEALFILARQTLNWIDLRGFHTCQCPPDAGNMRLLRLVGFESREDGELCADMTHMFDGSCGGRCSLAEELKKLSNDASI